MFTTVYIISARLLEALHAATLLMALIVTVAINDIYETLAGLLPRVSETQSLDDGLLAGLDKQKISHLEATIAGLNGRLAASVQQVEDHFAELKQQGSKTTFLKDKLEEENAALEQNLAATQTALDNKSRDLETVSLQLEQMRTNLIDVNDKLEKTEAAHSAELKKVRIQKNKCVKAAKIARELEKEKEEVLEKKLAQALAENEKLKCQLEEAQASRRDEGEGKTMRKVELEMKLKMALTDKAVAEDSLEDAVNEKEVMAVRVRQVEAERDALQKKYKQLDSKVHLVEQRSKIHFTKLQASVNECKDLREQLASPHEDKDESIAEKVRKIESRIRTKARRHIEEARQAYNRSNASRRVAEKKVAELQAKLEVLKAKDSEDEKEAQKSLEHVARLRSKFLAVKKERDEYEKQVKALRSTVAVEPSFVQSTKTEVVTSLLSGSLRDTLNGIENASSSC